MKHLITSALPYVNGVKHLGNLVGSMLPADVYARYLRAKGDEVLFICATDEHGTPTEIAAKQANMSPQAFCDRQYEAQLKMNEAYELSFDYFGRSSSKNNHELTQYIAKELEKNGFVEEKIINQFYSKEDGMFLPDRFIMGTCPHCGYGNARGDQCESCTKVLDPEDLIEPRSAVSGSRDLELRETKHLFLSQSKMVDELREWIEQKKEWPRLVKSIANKWLNDGLQDRCITRDLKWGVPVPKEGYEDKVFYVWFDAPISYISATKDWAEQNGEDYRKWWGADTDVKYTQFMGKDNIPFHTVSFPATLIGAGNEFKQPDQIKGVNWLNYYNGKFSTSSKRGIFMNQALDLYPADYWRYALISNIPEKDDVNFTWEEFAKSINGDLANMYGNFVQRASTMQMKYFGDKVPEVTAPEGKAEEELISKMSFEVGRYSAEMDKLEFRKAMTSLREIFKITNEYFTEKAPWKAAKEGRMDDVALTMKYALNMERLLAVLSEPMMPETSRKIYKALHLEDEKQPWPKGNLRAELNAVKSGQTVESPGILFQKITPEKIEELKNQFGDEKTASHGKGKELHGVTPPTEIRMPQLLIKKKTKEVPHSEQNAEVGNKREQASKRERQMVAAHTAKPSRDYLCVVRKKDKGMDR